MVRLYCGKWPDRKEVVYKPKIPKSNTLFNRALHSGKISKKDLDQLIEMQIITKTDKYLAHIIPLFKQNLQKYKNIVSHLNDYIGKEKLAPPQTIQEGLEAIIYAIEEEDVNPNKFDYYMFVINLYGRNLSYYQDWTKQSNKFLKTNHRIPDSVYQGKLIVRDVIRKHSLKNVVSLGV